MNELMDSMSLMVLLTGAILVLTMLMRHALSRTLVPPLVGYLLLGFGLRLLHEYTALLPYGHEALFAFLGNVGLVTLLFRVGLESNLSGLMEQFAPAAHLAGEHIRQCGRWLSGFALPSGFQRHHLAHHRRGLHRHKRGRVRTGMEAVRSPRYPAR
ncbi:hypothetical protein [Salidesulfovibrio brasiliensis]|uniref:hypothetical protein n=1 Tax=Salidesulfovibrio brasiliensis TaxID=221711 RepID=UPI0006D27379|nr:hypothetical protein [Salidesulfovibrio brasiliensis]